MPSATTWINLENIMLREISQTMKDKILYDLIYVCNLKNKKNKPQTPRYRERINGYQGLGLGEQVKCLKRIKRYKLSTVK